MIPRACKRLAEVDFPIAVVSKHSAREKSIRHGHPSTLHLWWARRPLAACRAMLLALLVPDPCDEHCPADFKTKARELLPKVQGKVGRSDEDLRKALLKFIGDFANWDLAANQGYLEVGRGLVKAAHGEEPPLVVDPFAGGGSIPLEALRLGCDAFASDLNPVACLILKVMLEDIPRDGPKLAAELRRVGTEIRKEAEEELAGLYPRDPDGATPIAYLWARTVLCEAPNCGAEIPLVRSLWLCRKASRRRALRYQVSRREHGPPAVEFEIFTPGSEDEVALGFASGGKARCPGCGVVLAGQRVMAQLTAHRGGGSPRFDSRGTRVGGAVITAVVTARSGSDGRNYRAPTPTDYTCCFRAGQRSVPSTPQERINPVRPSPNARGLSAVTRYGLSTFGELYSQRQLVALSSFTRLAARLPDSPVKRLLALVLGRAANAWTSVCRWHLTGEKVEGAFNGQKLPMVWDFAEAVPFSGATGGWDGALEWVSLVADRGGLFTGSAQTEQADADAPVLPDSTASVWFTDPPYYDSVPYADLSDFFLVWLKRAIPELRLGDPYSPDNPLSPKTAECVWNQNQMDQDGLPKSPSFFERKFSAAAASGRGTLRDDGVACVVFAHKSTEGWEALIGGLTAGGFVVSGSWPIATEMAQRTNARNTASLLGSVHLVCRPRHEDADIGDWADVLRKLPHRVGDWMERLQAEGVRGADLVFACIGPALEIFTSHSRVETADGREVPLAEYLEKVWEVVGRTALGQVLGTAEAKARNGAAGAVEEDARLTALFLWTHQSTAAEDAEDGDEAATDDESSGGEDDDESLARGKAKGYTLVYDVVRRFAQPLGIELPQWESRIIETKKGVVRLLPVAERAKQLFGDDGAGAVADQLERAPVREALQGSLFPEQQAAPAAGTRPRGRGRKKAGAPVADDKLAAQAEATTLDRVHVAMLLQRVGRANALKALIKAEQEQGPDFVRLANALSALYPKDAEEKRLLDAMLLAVPR